MQACCDLQVAAKMQIRTELCLALGVLAKGLNGLLSTYEQFFGLQGPRACVAYLFLRLYGSGSASKALEL